MMTPEEYEQEHSPKLPSKKEVFVFVVFMALVVAYGIYIAVFGD